MRSRFRSVALYAIAGVIAVTGCRDMVVPETPDTNRTDLLIQVVGLGSDGPLHNALVTIDNSPYVEADRAGQWQTTTHHGSAIFEGRAPGDYDVHVDPRGSGPGTPPWEETSVPLDDSLIIIAYEGFPVEFVLDWPELEEIAPEDTSVWVEMGFSYFDDEGTYTGSGRQIATATAPGRLVGVIPWAGDFRVDVEGSGEDFYLSYSLADPVPLEPGSALTLPSPMELHPMALQMGGAPADLDVVSIHNGYAAVGGQINLRRLQLGYDLDLTVLPDVVYLIPETGSEFTLSWTSGPAFMPRSTFLTDEAMSPGTIELGQHELRLRVVDHDDQPVPEAFITATLGSRSDTWQCDAAGELRCFLNSGACRFEVQAPGFIENVSVMQVDGDQSATIVLESE